MKRWRPLSLDEVRLEDRFWTPIRERNRRITLPIQYQQCLDTGRLAAWKLDWKPGDPNKPHIFWDSDVGKWIEAAAYTLHDRRDAELEARIDEVVEWMSKAQHPDGYLNTYFTVVEPGKRWTNLRDNHELYCAGHLAEGAIAYFEATEKRKFLDMICRYMDHIAREFGQGPDQKRGYPGHPEIELALVKLYRATGVKRYLELAAFFVEARGTDPHYYDEEARLRGEDPADYPFQTYAYCQAHLPVRRQTEPVGHAVRALYLYSGMTDVALETGDESLLETCRILWRALVQRRMHITGGVGPSHANEGLTTDYDLPHEGAYLETCAAVALVFWAWRLLQAELRGEYGDVLERALYNGTLSGVSADGKQFFYGNPLGAHPGFDGNGCYCGRDYHYRRSDWFGTACCPPNVARMIGQMPQFIAAKARNTLAIHLYAGGTLRAALDGGENQLQMSTHYPWEEETRIRVQATPPTEWELALRLPGWCRNPQWRLNGREVEAPVEEGYLRLSRKWKVGDEVRLVLPMPVECIEAHPAARQTCGRVALQRGPVVYVLEGADNGKNLSDLQLMPDAVFELADSSDPLFHGVPLIQTIARSRDPQPWEGNLYQPPTGAYAKRPIRFIPYFLWANRQPGEMITWIRQS